MVIKFPIKDRKEKNPLVFVNMGKKSVIIGLTVLFVVLFLLMAMVIVIFVVRSLSVDSYADMQRGENGILSIIREIPSSNKISYPVIYINLDRSPERREFMEKQLDYFKIKYTRMKGIDGKLIDINNGEIRDYFDRPVKYANTYTTITKSELGCTLSHLCAIKAAYEMNYENVLIFEDDISLNLMPLWTKTLPERIKEAPSDWEILQLFSYDREIDIKKSFHRCEDGTYYWSCAAYLINRKGMQNVLGSSMKGETFTIGHQEYDGLADVFIYSSTKNTYVCSVPLFYPANDHKTMNSTIHTGHTDFHIRRSREMIEYYLSIPCYHEKDNWYHDRFIEKLFSPRQLTELHYPAPAAIVIFAAPSQKTQASLNEYRENYVLMVDGEPHDISDLRGASLIITTKKSLTMRDGTPTVYVPLYAFNVYGFKDPIYTLDDLLKKSNVSNLPSATGVARSKNRKFCCFMYSNCDEKQEGVKFRKDFLDRLQEKSGGRVDVLGKCYNSSYVANGTHLDSTEIFRDYKFVISVENSFIDGYMSEKLVNPMIAGAIPIYMGAPDVATDFDTNSFIHIRDYRNIDECIDKILLLDSNDELYREKLAAPWFRNNTIPKHITLEDIRERIRPYLPF